MRRALLKPALAVALVLGVLDGGAIRKSRPTANRTEREIFIILRIFDDELEPAHLAVTRP